MMDAKRFYVIGNRVYDRLNHDREVVECASEEEAELWAANDHHEKALKPIGRD